MCPIQTTDAANPYYYKTRRGSSTWSHSKTKGCCHANFFQKKLYLHQIILLINLLQLRHLKSQITFHPFVLLYNNYTLHPSYKKTVKKTWNFLKIEKRKDANLFRKKIIFTSSYSKNLIYSYKKKTRYIYTRSYAYQIVSQFIHFSATHLKRKTLS